MGGNEVFMSHTKTNHVSFIELMTKYDPIFRENVLFESGFRVGKICGKSHNE